MLLILVLALVYIFIFVVIQLLNVLNLHYPTSDTTTSDIHLIYLYSLRMMFLSHVRVVLMFSMSCTILSLHSEDKCPCITCEAP